MSLRRRRAARTAGVSLEVVVMDYLREVAEREDRDRSYCINQIVREHAQRHGRLLPPALPPPERAPQPPAEEPNP